VAGLKLRWRQEKGLDTTKAADDYTMALDAALGGDGAAPILSISGPAQQEKLLDEASLPETGYGV